MRGGWTGATELPVVRSKERRERGTGGETEAPLVAGTLHRCGCRCGRSLCMPPHVLEGGAGGQAGGQTGGREGWHGLQEREWQSMRGPEAGTCGSPEVSSSSPFVCSPTTRPATQDMFS